MNASDVLNGPVTPDTYAIREHYRIRGNVQRMRTVDAHKAEMEKYRGRDGVIYALDQCIKECSRREIAVTDLFKDLWALHWATGACDRKLEAIELRAKDLGINPFDRSNAEGQPRREAT